MNRTACLVALTVAVFAMSCEKKNPTPAKPAPGAAADTKGAAASGDFSSPSATIRTFFAAAQKKDKALLAQCFSKTSPGEFKSIVDGTVSEGDLNELAEMCTGASIVETDAQLADAKGANHAGEKINGDNATVGVRFPKRGETISLVKEGSRWVILDF